MTASIKLLSAIDRRINAFKLELQILNNVILINHDDFSGQELLDINDFENTVKDAIQKLEQVFRHENSSSDAEVRSDKRRKRFYYSNRAKRASVV